MVTSSASTVRRVEETVRPVVEAAGLHLDGVVVSPAGRRSVVRIVVDLHEDAIGGLDLDALGEVSRDVSAALDAQDPVRGAYVLEVSTPGTDRPLTQMRHFRRARTRLVRLALSDGSTVAGRLVEVDGEDLVVTTETGTVRAAVSDVAHGVVEVEMRHLHEEGVPEADGLDDTPEEEA